MKLIHLSDLHIGLRLHEMPLLEDQEHILRQILAIVDEEAADAVILAGDLYDKAVPPAEAVKVLDDFLAALARRRKQVFIISGNHDSPERIAFGGRLMDAAGIHIAPVYDGCVEPIVLRDEWGEIAFWLLPFLKPAHVRQKFPDEAIENYTDALRTAIGQMGPDTRRRNVLVTHQFVTGSMRCDSERVTVGGTDNVDAAVFDGFDYVALGHIHSPQDVEKDRIRYCGTPLKYSFSEVGQQKSVTVVELEEKGSVRVTLRPLKPLRELVQLRGTYDELMTRSRYEGTTLPTDLVGITLTDEMPIPNAMKRMQQVYKNLLHLQYDNSRTRAAGRLLTAETEQKTDLELALEHYRFVNGQDMTAQQQAFLTALLEETEEMA